MLKTLMAAFDKRLTPATMAAYFEHLSVFDAAVVDRVCRRAAASKDRFPSIADLRQACLSEQRSQSVTVADDGVPPPNELPRFVLEFCAGAGMVWAKRRLEEAA